MPAVLWRHTNGQTDNYKRPLAAKYINSYRSLLRWIFLSFVLFFFFFFVMVVRGREGGGGGGGVLLFQVFRRSGTSSGQNMSEIDDVRQ